MDSINFHELMDQANIPQPEINPLNGDEFRGDMRGSSMRTRVHGWLGRILKVAEPADSDVMQWNDTDKMWEPRTLQVRVYTNAARPAAGTEGRIIFNSDDGQLNIDDGTNWTLPDGTTT